jgi:Domain of unknown function (DUF362)
MKRREFILASAGMTAWGLLPAGALARELAAAERRLPEPYDDNKVVRVYDPRVADYQFGGQAIPWKTINQAVLAQMLDKALLEISGEKNGARAWKKILAGTTQGKLSDKRIAVKVNFNNTIRDVRRTLNNSPAMISVLARSLADAGFAQRSICVFDCSRPFPQEFKAVVRQNRLEEVTLLGKGDQLPASGQMIFLSDNRGMQKAGKPLDRYPIPQCVMEADYLINLHLVKIHMPGVTGAMKNLFGLQEDVGFYMHQPGAKSFERAFHLPDISLNEDIRKRARLNLAEFIFGGHTPDTLDKFTNETFFPGGLPASLIVSRSPFYHDTVLRAFIEAEYETCVPVLTRFQTIGPDLWLRNSAERYPAWKFDHAGHPEAKQEGRPRKDLAFAQVNYVSI